MPEPAHGGDGDRGQNQRHRDTPGDEHANRVHEDESAALGMEAIEVTDRRWQGEQVFLGHLEDALAGMVLRLPGEQLAISVHFDVPAEDEGDRAVLQKVRDPCQ